MKIGVTGATGFIGKHFVRMATERGYEVLAIPRSELEKSGCLYGADVVVHLAGIAHARAPEHEMKAINAVLTTALARQALTLGCKRFVFVSSVAAEAGSTAYGRSKKAAEDALLNIHGLETVILRPPLVYGAGANGTFGLLTRAAKLPIPLPFEDANKARSALSAENLADALLFSSVSPSIEQGPHNVTDGADTTLKEMISLIRMGMGRSKNLFSAPWLPALLARAGRQKLSDQLFGELTFENQLGRYGWRAPTTPEQALLRVGSQL